MEIRAINGPPDRRRSLLGATGAVGVGEGPATNVLGEEPAANVLGDGPAANVLGDGPADELVASLWAMTL
jgi:hypothetical protein